MLSFVTSPITLSAILLSVVILNVVMLSVVAPLVMEQHYFYFVANLGQGTNTLAYLYTTCLSTESFVVVQID
jgi:hypothetical protein